jgi:hypothetical protein
MLLEYRVVIKKKKVVKTNMRSKTSRGFQVLEWYHKIKRQRRESAKDLCKAIANENCNGCETRAVRPMGVCSFLSNHQGFFNAIGVAGKNQAVHASS